MLGKAGNGVNTSIGSRGAAGREEKSTCGQGELPDLTLELHSPRSEPLESKAAPPDPILLLLSGHTGGRAGDHPLKHPKRSLCSLGDLCPAPALAEPRHIQPGGFTSPPGSGGRCCGDKAVPCACFPRERGRGGPGTARRIPQRVNSKV